MSMHEFEDLVEDSVRLLAATPGQADLRSVFWNLYELQAAWDTGFTHFRVMELLVEHHFVYRFELTDHPDHAQHAAYFDGLTADDFEIQPPGVKEWDGGYTDWPHLYCDAGSPLWRRFVQLGRLGGADAEPPQAIDLYAIARDVAGLAEARGNRPLIARWYRILAAHAMAQCTDGIGESLRENPALRELRAIVQRTGALEIAFDYGLLDAKNYPPPELAGVPLLVWWYQLGGPAARLDQ